MTIRKYAQVGGQVRDELDAFIVICERVRPTSYLEVGAREGIAMRYLVERIPSIRRVCCVDWPEQKWGHVGSQAKLIENCEALGMDYDLVLGDSHDPENIYKVASMDTFDVVFIDGDHTYDGVKQDLDDYGRRAEMLIGLHDVNHPPDSNAYGPTRLFEERWEQYNGAIKLVHPDSKKGIGVFVL